MGRRKLSLVLLIGLLMTTVVFAAVDENMTPQELYAKFRNAYMKFHNFQANFEETTYLGKKKSVAKGRLVFAKPNLLRKEYLDPKDPAQLAQLIVLDGKIAWSYTPWLGQVTKQDMGGEEHKELLPGFGETLENLLNNYDVKIVKDEIANSKGIYKAELRLKPRSGVPATNEKIEVWIDSKTWLIHQIAYHNAENENTTILSFTKPKVDQELPEDTFKFIVPEGVEIINIGGKPK